MSAASGLIIAAPSSGSGKTTITLGILRALARNGVEIRGAKSGPDYIDPRFHEAACGAPCMNLDAWAMLPERIHALAAGAGRVLIEGAMGLFDGAPPDGKGSVADLARMLDLPVVLVVDAARMAQSVAPLVAGFAAHDPSVQIAGVILNKTGSARHERMLRTAIQATGLQVLGAVPRQNTLEHPSRHLGLVQAQERPDLEAFLDQTANTLRDSVDLSTLETLFKPLQTNTQIQSHPAPAQRIAIARDAAFAFAYPHLLADWRRAGAQVSLFSPLADQPVPECDLVILPGGYPELYAGQLSQAQTWMKSLRHHAETKQIYGECGGYMALGDGMIDAKGTRHQMAGLLRLETSFAQRKLHLGYRQLSASHGPFKGRWMGHEFHYASTIKAQGPSLFEASDAEGNRLPDMGLTAGNVAGSFGHIIDVAN